MDYITVPLLLVISAFSAIQPVFSESPALLLTPLIKQNKTSEARLLSLVDKKLFLNITSHSGFLTVDEKYNSNTFIWYFPVVDKPVNETPWIIWLQGGPGASSLDGLFLEIGPFEYNGELKLRELAWSREHSMLFIDNPIGAGYSFTDDQKGFATNIDTYSNHLYSALQQFLTVFPELRTAPLYIAGESYAGRFVPALATRVLEASPLPEESAVNLQGVLLGNPVLNREDVTNLTAAFYQWGLVDSQGVQEVKSLQDQYTAAVIQNKTQSAYELRQKLLNKLDDISNQKQTYNVLADDYQLQGFVEFLAREDVREAMHVGSIRFAFVNTTTQEKIVPDFLTRVQTDVEKLLDHYKVMIYCGQLDLTVPCVPNSEARWNKWHWSHREEYHVAPRTPWWYNDSIAGYVRSGGGLTEVLVRNAGHLVPLDKPGPALQLISTFIRGSDIDKSPTRPNYLPTSTTTPKPQSKPTEIPQHRNSSGPTVAPSSTSIAPTTKPLVAEVNVTEAPGSTIPPTKMNSSQPYQSKDVDTKSTSTQNSSKETIVIASEGSGPSAGTIVSIILNVFLASCLMFGGYLYYRQRRRTENFYTNVDNNSDDIFLT